MKDDEIKIIKITISEIILNKINNNKKIKTKFVDKKFQLKIIIRKKQIQS